MRYPPAFTYTPARSRFYMGFAGLFAIILIANYVYLTGGKAFFSLINGLFLLLTAMMVLALLLDALRKPRGSLSFSQGQWLWQLGEQEIAGTLRLHFDLQSYMLVSFVPHLHEQARALQRITGFFTITTSWFHLEARQSDRATSQQDWLALRRAVYAQAAHHEERAA